MLALIIEDDDDLAFVFSKALETAGYEPEAIRNGVVAQQRLDEVTPSLVVLDLHLPGVSGKTLLEKMKADDRLASTPVILATADATLAETLRNKATLVLLKPISFSQLRDLSLRASQPGSLDGEEGE